MVIAANADNVFRRLCEAMGRPELADDERFATHLARGENQDEIEGIVADWAREHDAAEIDRILNEAGVICGPIYTIADIFEDPQFRAREMLVEHVDPEFGPYIGPGVVPKLTRTPGAVRWSATWEEGSHNDEVYGGLLGLDERRAGEPARGGRDLSASVTICDVGPRDGLQNDAVTLEPAVRAELVDRLAAAGVPRIEAVSFVHPERVPQMAGAEEVVAAIHPVRRRHLRRARPQRARLRPVRDDGARPRRTTPSPSARSSTSGTPAPRPRSRPWRASASSQRAKADGIRATVTLGTSFGCPFEGAVDPGRVLELAARFAAGGADEIVFADTVGVGVPRQVRHLVGEGVKLGVAGRRPPPQHAQHGLRERARRARGGRDGARRLDRRDRRLPVRAARDGEHRDGGPRLPAPRRGHRDGNRPRAADRGRGMARGRLGRPLEGQVYKAGAFAPVMAH